MFIYLFIYKASFFKRPGQLTCRMSYILVLSDYFFTVPFSFLLHPGISCKQVRSEMLTTEVLLAKIGDAIYVPQDAVHEVVHILRHPQLGGVGKSYDHLAKYGHWWSL